MFERRLARDLETAIGRSPVVGLIGPRQVGKTTLAHALARHREPPPEFLDLERPVDRARLTDAEAALRALDGRLVVLDEIQRVPDLFPVLRVLVDERRRAGQPGGHFLVLGSASVDLLRQSSESLAGRIEYLELAPFDLLEAGDNDLDRLWLRGGFPESFLARDDETSIAWRQQFATTYLERDVAAFAPRLPRETLRRFWTMLAHEQGGEFNAARLAAGLGVSAQTVSRYLDLLVDLMLVRRLPAWFGNVGKRLRKAPRTYLRDSGMVHALLGIDSLQVLLGHPVCGGSWEGLVVENLAGAAGPVMQPHWYRTSAGAEIDLLLVGAGQRIAVEIKRSTAPAVSRGFHLACDDVCATQRWLIYPGRDAYPGPHGVEVLPLGQAMARLRA
ncbi:MAG: ATP-binding protein [Chromatiales bacterium]|jgi:predicted AAA+ superfamily ATPase|nr:ATP-binding protein [Chromatiales bacterium]